MSVVPGLANCLDVAGGVDDLWLSHHLHRLLLHVLHWLLLYHLHWLLNHLLLDNLLSWR